MFKKIEIWILYIVLVGVFISYIIFGAMVRREALGGGNRYIPIITPISKLAFFLAEIPNNLLSLSNPKNIDPHIIYPNKYDGYKKGFEGKKLDFESYLLLSRYDGNIKEHIVELVNLQSFKIVHVWNPDIDVNFNIINESVNWGSTLERQNDYKFRMVHPMLLEDGALLVKGQNTPLYKIDSNSNVIWSNDHTKYHHSIEKDANGDFWVCNKFYNSKVKKELLGSKFDDDGVALISRNGDLLWQKSITEIFMENEMGYLLFSLEKRTNDPIHLNDIQPVIKSTDYWEKGDLFLSLRNQSMVILYRPSTNKIIWKGTGPFHLQHDINIIDDEKISVFNNNAKHFANGTRVDESNEIIIYDFATESYSYYLKDKLKRNNIKTAWQGRGEILPNGDLLIEETNHGRQIYFKSDGSVIWSYQNIAENNQNYIVNWSRIIYKTEEIKNIQRFLKNKVEEIKSD